MRSLIPRFVAIGLLLSCPLQAQLVISQVYGGGGNTGAPYRNDYVEIFNSGSATASLTGLSVQYASATGTGNFGGNPIALLTGSLLPGQYYLVQLAGGANGVALPTPDATGTANMSGTGGKVVLVNSTSGIACNGGSTPCSPAQLALIVDLVGWGSANFFEGAAAAPATTNTTAVFRASGGCTDTNSNSADFAAAAPAPRNTASALNVCGAPAPLTITTGTPLPSATLGVPYSVTFAASGGSGSGYNFLQTAGTLPPGLTLVGSVLGGAPNTTAGSPFSFSIQVTDSDGATASKTFSLTVTAPTCTVTHTISQIQGSGNISPVVGPGVTTSGIVTARKSNGFFIQMPAPGDSDPATSDGLFVFTSSAPPSTATVGYSVCVSGSVSEYIPSADPASPSLTEITGPTIGVLSTGNSLPAPVALTAADTPPSGSIDQLEKYEGMRVQVNSLTVVGPTRGNVSEASATATSNGIFYGVITGLARPFREAGIEVPDPLPSGSPCCVTRWDANPEVLAVASLAQSGAAAIDVSTGATVTNLVGTLDFGSRSYTIDADPSPAPGIAGNTLTFTAVPIPSASEVTVASFNMERFFDTVNDPSISDVALTAAAFANRLNKASLAIRNVLRYPDILGVEEMENLTTLQAVAEKVNANAVTAGDTNPNYQAFLVEGNDIGGIDVGFLVKTTKVSVTDVTQYGKDTTYIDPTSGSPELLNDRPPLVLRATVQSFPLTVIVNHLRSLNGIDDPVDGPRVRAKREAQAEYLANLIQTFQNSDARAAIVSVGDYNAYQFSDGYVDVIGAIKGTPVPSNQVVLASPAITTPALSDLVDTLPNDQRYSYSFSGSGQVLDHVLVNPGAFARLTRFAYARNDADFPEVFRTDANRPERLSDHDIPVAYFSTASPSLVTGLITAKSGVQNARVWTVTFSNTGGGSATGLSMNGFTLTQASGAACTPVILGPAAYPVQLGTLAAAERVSTNVVIDFTGCTATARFTVTAPFSANGGATAGVMKLYNQFR